MKHEYSENRKEDILIQSIKSIILECPELKVLIEQVADERFKTLCFDKRLTPDEMAETYGVSRSTIDRLTKQELSKLGWQKVRIASLPRFQRIVNVEVSKENFKKAKKR